MSTAITPSKRKKITDAQDHLHERARQFAKNGNATNAEKLELAALQYARAMLIHVR